jgi:hypothetical protein
MKPTKDSNLFRYERIQHERCPECGDEIPDGRVGKCESCRKKLRLAVEEMRQQHREAGLCRCGKSKPVVGLVSCKGCLFGKKCPTCKRAFTKDNPWCWDHEWYEDFPRRIAALREYWERTQAEPVPSYINTYTVKEWSKHTGINLRTDLPLHWQIANPATAALGICLP